MVYTSSGCTKFQKDSIQIFSSLNEQVKLNYEDIFINRDFSEITIIDESRTLSKVDPIKLLEQIDYDATQILAVDVLLQDLSYEWKNKFAALVKNNNKYQILISSQINQGQKSRIPQFDKFSTDIVADLCYDLAMLSSSIVVADCIFIEENGGIQNVMFFWNDETQTLTKKENDILIGYPSTTKRKLFAANQQIFRVFLYDSNQEQQNSIIEVFNQQGVLEYYFDIFALMYLTKKTKNLQIVDFRISTVGQIAILNYDGTILEINYSQRETKWKLLYEFQYENIPKSFDFNFKLETYVISFGNQILYQSLTDQFSQTLTFDFYLEQIYMAQSVIFALGKGLNIYSFDYELRYISYMYAPKIKFLLSDCTQDDMILIQQSNIQRYLLLKQHTLIHKSNIIYEDTHVSQLIQYLQNNKNCTLQIYHSTVSTDTERIFVSETNQTLFSDPIPTYPKGAQLHLNSQLIYGQNLKLNFQNISKAFVKLDLEVKKFDQSFIHIEPSDDPYTYFSAVQIEKEYLITQKFDDDWAHFIYCPITDSSCIDYGMMKQLDQLRQNNSCTWSQSNTMFLAFPQKNPNRIYLLMIQNKMMFNGTKTTNSYVDKIQKSKEVLLLFSVGNSTIESYYASYIDIKLLFVISSETIQALGVKQWAPSGIHANPESTRVFVRNLNDNQVIILSCSLIGFSIIDILTFQDKVQDILIFEKYFAIMINNQYLIYDMAQQEDIHFVRYLPSFGYKMNIAKRYTYDGWIYIASDNKLLVYQVNKLSINSLWHVIDEYDETFLTAFANKIFIKENTVIEFYNEFNVQQTCEMDNSLLIEQVFLTTHIENKNQNAILSSVETIRNFQTEIQLHQDDFNVKKQFPSKKSEICQTISDNWIKNSVVTNIEISCRNCNKEINLYQYLNQNNVNYLDAGVEIKELDQDQLIILFPNNFTIIDKLSKSTHQVVQFNYTCTQILYSSSDKILLKCNIQDSYYIVQWVDSFNFFDVDDSNITISSKLIDLALFGNYMYLIEKYYIVIYHCSKEEFKLKDCKFSDSSKLPGYYLNIFFDTDKFFLYFYDYQINILSCSLGSDYFCRYQYMIDINKIIENHGFQKVDEEWLNLYTISSEKGNSGIIQKLLLISQRYLHFQITAELIPDTSPQIEKLVVLQNYADWVAIKSTYYYNKLIIQYQKNQQSILTLYELSQEEVINPIGGITVSTKTGSNFQIINELDKTFLYSVNENQQGYYNKYRINDDLQLCIDGGLKSQMLKFNVSNGFNSQIVIVDITLVQYYIIFWQMWVLIVVILVCSVVGFFIWKQKKKEKQRKEAALFG